jgi:hypothetical protein
MSGFTNSYQYREMPLMKMQKPIGANLHQIRADHSQR